MLKIGFLYRFDGLSERFHTVPAVPTGFPVSPWLPADAISIGELELLFEGQHNGTYEGAYTVSLDMPEQAGMDIRNSSAALAEEGKKTAFVLKHDTVIAVIGYRETIRE